MSAREFAVIELDKPRKPGVSVFQQLANDVATSGARLEVRAMTARDEQEVIADDRYVCHAPAIPLELVAPVATESADATPQLAWGIGAVGAEPASFHGDGTSVAVLDTGIDLEHDAFRSIKDRITVRDFSRAGSGDPLGHGTHCAATIFGQDVDGVRVGIARNVSRAFVGRVFDNAGNATTLGLFEAMQAAIMWKAQVVSMSLGFNFPAIVETLISSGLPTKVAAARALNDFLANMRVFDTLVKLARDMVPITGGTVVVAAAGNASVPAYRLPLVQPANADGVISVGAVETTQEGYKVATFSNTGPSLCGPGVGVLSAVPSHRRGNKLELKDGTSMAAPHVAGVTALWFQALRQRGEQAIATIVAERVKAHATSHGFASGTRINDRGSGLVKAP